ncbi:isoleucyl-tRNA synthetase, putative [Bodo saltans]|uniref:isoleucine--tRNA ligase n=1 Tax=Bodo saltans TaxID=75058 RepID=A0A0S4J4I8_BODSA|nr:isoleucyl-tRNA synthetase, putative [Bodo saltans]|eukprot:CUG86385.1 isoleucyl-tRNA synthetase, putative [Bodo saltans]
MLRRGTFWLSSSSSLKSKTTIYQFVRQQPNNSNPFAPTMAAAPAGTGPLKDFPEPLNFAKMEEEVLAYWKEIKAFETSLKKSEGRKPYTFYDGPPFATGLPHYGHILAGTIKDVVCRYAHQTGHHVERRFGWDCHGLPIEFEIEKLLGIKSSHDVKAFGIANYNAECRKIVMRFANEWEEVVTRVGRWIDFKNDYKTMNLSYMESVWWVFKQLWEKKLVYRGFKVMPFSTSCTTPLSNFEANMNYKDVSDPSAMVSFPLEEDNNTHLIAWTTTPWTLPSNLALCVNPDMEYVKVLDAKTSRHYIFAECRIGEVYKINAKDKDKELPYTSDSGTGVVHCAPGFGEEDNRACLANKVFEKGTIVCPVDENGHFTADVTEWAGRYIKDCDNEILKVIQQNGRLINKAAVVHSYPFCWRSDTPLIYKAVDSWFVGVESIRDKLLEANAATSWVPDFVKSKRFSNWLEDAKDWNVSRNRYWGTPLPVWRSDDWEEIICIGSVAELEELSGVTGINDIHREFVDTITIPSKFFFYWEEIICIGSVAELEELSGVTGINDIHREFVDTITIPSKRPGMPPLRRVEEVFDCWFESGSMPFGQAHYPFENKEKFMDGFPADFVAEGLDQTRGWFYTMLVLSTALFGHSSYKNLVVNGLVLAEDGKKMSKRLKNYLFFFVPACLPSVASRKCLDGFPADFVAEGLDQTRGWFYTMLVLSTALFGHSSYKNLVVNGLVLAEDGKKMSKRLKNYPEPTIVVDNYGADALRLYLINSPVVRAEPLRFREAGVKDIVKDVFLPLANAAKFFITNANRFISEGGSISINTTSSNEMDRWILASAQTLVKCVHNEMNQYHLYTVVPHVLRFVEELTNWYVRMNRRRIKGTDEDRQDWGNSLSTFLDVLFTVSRVLAPFTPFIAESLYQRIKPLLPEEVQEDSIHYIMLPEVDASKFDEVLEQSMSRMIKVVDLVRVLRDRIGIPMKMPVRQVIVVHPNREYLDDVSKMGTYIKHEVNAFDVNFSEEGEYVITKLDGNMGAIGKRFKKEGMSIKKALMAMGPEEVRAFIAAEGGVVCDQQLTMEDVKILRTFREGIEEFESNTDNDVVVLVDKRSDEALVNAWRAREFVNRVQQLRKKAKLVITDRVDVFFSSPDAGLVASILGASEQISQTVKGLWTTEDKMPADAEKIAEEDNDISEIPIKITFTKPSA